MTIQNTIVVIGTGLQGRPTAYGASAFFKAGLRFISGFPLR